MQLASLASSHRTILFALATCAAFGLAIRDTLREPEHDPDEDEVVPRRYAAASEEPITDSVPSALEFIEADDAFARAAAARAEDPEKITRALRILVDPDVAPASWLRFDDASSRARIDVIHRLGIDFAYQVANRELTGGLFVWLGASVPCVELVRAVQTVWGRGHVKPSGEMMYTWTGSSGYRAAMRADADCMLHIERVP